MSGVNKVIVLGYMGQDPEVKMVGNNKVAALSIATTEKWKDKDQKEQARTEWHRVIVWGKLADVCEKYTAKGKQIYVEGKLQTRSWEADGKKHYITEIIANSIQLLGSSGDGGRRDTGPADSFGGQPGGSYDASQEGPL